MQICLNWRLKYQVYILFLPAALFGHIQYFIPNKFLKKFSGV